MPSAQLIQQATATCSTPACPRRRSGTVTACCTAPLSRPFGGGSSPPTSPTSWTHRACRIERCTRCRRSRRATSWRRPRVSRSSPSTDSPSAPDLRLGELLALRWSEVDLERHTLSVVATLEHRHGHEPVIAEPKTARSRRRVQLGTATVEALRVHRQAQPGIGFVFTRADGRPLSRSMVDKAWRALNERAGVPAVRFHDLRHTAATLLLGQGINPKIVSEMLGHSTVAITLDLYSHVTPTMQLAAASAMDELLSQ